MSTALLESGVSQSARKSGHTVRPHVPSPSSERARGMSSGATIFRGRTGLQTEVWRLLRDP